MGEMFCCRLTGLVQNITQVDVCCFFVFFCLISFCYRNKKKGGFIRVIFSYFLCTARV